MGYWDKIKELISLKAEEKKGEEIVFTPEELREMRDPDTAVGRMLNPYDLEEYAKGGARELYYKGLGRPEKSNLSGGPQEKDTVGLTADAYIKDAIKRGIIQPDEDRITQNYKVIDDFKKRKDLEDVIIEHAPTEKFGAWGQYFPGNKTNPSGTINLSNVIHPFYSIDPNKKRTKGNSSSVERILRALENRPYSDEELEDVPISEQKYHQKFMADRHLGTAIHELTHAEDFKNDPEEFKKGHHGHFKDATRYRWENDADSGRIHDIEQATLQRLANMGTKKVRKKDE